MADLSEDFGESLLTSSHKIGREEMTYNVSSGTVKPINQSINQVISRPWLEFNCQTNEGHDDQFLRQSKHIQHFGLT